MSGRGWTVAAALALAGFSPFRAEERNVREGNERLTSGDAAGALGHYDAAEKAVGARPEIDYDRGDAYWRMGKAAEARDAWRRAQEKAPGPLASRASQNLGTALAAGGDAEGAIAAFTRALRQDPGNEDARFGLEVLLRRKQASQERQQAQQQPGEAKSAPGEQPRAGQGPQDRTGQRQPGAQAPPPAAGQPPPAPPPPAPGPAPEPGRPGSAEAQPGAGDAPIPRQEAERILDAFRSREQPLPTGAERGRVRAPEVERDW